MLLGAGSYIYGVPEYFSEYENIVFGKVDFADFVRHTPVDALWSSGTLTRRGFYLNNMSNALRLVLLMRFGGVYLDTDVVSLRPLPKDERNFLVAHETNNVNNAIMRFSRRHPFVNFTLSQLANNFKASKWGNQVKLRPGKFQSEMQRVQTIGADPDHGVCSEVLPALD